MCTSMIAKNGRVLDCGKCAECLSLEAWRWTQRVKIESMFATKTWFTTFTYRGKREVGYSEIQKMFKRLRKGNKKKKKEPKEFRYLCVAEEGEKKGRLHYHAVIHGKLTKREVQGEWKHGFSTAKLTNDSDSARARYISKYISKAKSKIGGKCYRASIGYGKKQLHSVLDQDKLVESIMQRFPDSRVISLANVKIPYKFQYKNSSEQKQKYKIQNAHRRDGT